jgi:4-hydroxy-tetrahydrodipicolinate reductase
MNRVSSARLRVVQCGTGNIGRRALREVIRHPELELAGVQVYDAAKEGVDAGPLCGEEPVGVVATRDGTAIRALAADCALYMPSALDLDHVVALLESGTNVVTTRGELFAGGSRLGDERTRVVDACERGGSSIYAAGSSPGFITDALPFALLSLQRRVELVEIEEFANLSRRDSPALLFELMGFGRPLESFDARRSSYLLGEFGPPLGMLMEAAGTPVGGSAGGATRATPFDRRQRHRRRVSRRNVRRSPAVEGPTWCSSRRTGTAPPTWTSVDLTDGLACACGDAPLDVQLKPIPLDDLAIPPRTPPTGR